MKLWMGLLIGLFLLPAIGALVIAGGFVDISATSVPGSVERKIASYARDRWIARHAPKKTIGAPNEKQIEAGREHYRANCIVCHVAPEIPASELAKGMNPPPPRLDGKETQARSDGELYWIVSQGIRMTGMPAFSPTHSESEISNVVAFIRRLPRLTDEDRSFLRRAVGEESEHHHAGSDEHAAESAKSAAPAPPSDPEDHGHSREHQPLRLGSQVSPHEDPLTFSSSRSPRRSTSFRIARSSRARTTSTRTRDPGATTSWSALLGASASSGSGGFGQCSNSH